MEIHFKYNIKYHFSFIVLGVILGLVLGNSLVKQFSYDFNEIQQKCADVNVEISNERIIANMETQKMLFPYIFMFLIGGIFNGTYLFISYIKSKSTIYKVLTMIIFPIAFMVYSFIGILFLIPLFIYDIYCLLKR